MKPYAKLLCVICTVGLMFSWGCSSPTPAINVDATVGAAVAATDAAKMASQATIDAAVKSTAAAVPTQTALPTYTPQPTNAPIPTLAPQPSPTVVNAAQMSQQEMAAEVDTSVQQANNATTQTSVYTNQAAADGVLTSQEVALLLMYAGFTTQEINQAYALAEEYLKLYADLADETLALLTAVEQDLAAMNQSITALTATLNEINKAIQQGQAVSQEAIKKLQTQAQQASAKAVEAKTAMQSWSKVMQAELDKRSQALQNLKPNQVAADRAGALKQVQDYVTQLKTALGDGKLSKVELSSITQLGVNAAASLKSFGGIGTEKLPDAIGTLNQQIARGQLPQAKAGLSNLESLVPKRP